MHLKYESHQVSSSEFPDNTWYQQVEVVIMQYVFILIILNMHFTG